MKNPKCLFSVLCTIFIVACFHVSVSGLNLVLLTQGQPAPRPTTIDINTVLMRSTFKLSGRGSTGTAFILGKPMPGDATKAYYVMVTAAHILNQIQGDQATLFLRTKQGDVFRKVAYNIRIRNGQRALWTPHPSADVAVMYVSLPDDVDISLISTDLVATDDIIRKFELHPG